MARRGFPCRRADFVRLLNHPLPTGNRFIPLTATPNGVYCAGKMAEARRLAGDNVTSEQRAVAGLVVRGAEARLRRSTDLTLRAALDRRPIEPLGSRLAAEGSTESVSAAVHFEGGRASRTAGASTAEAAGCCEGRYMFNHASGGGVSGQGRQPHQAQPAQSGSARGNTVGASSEVSVASLSDVGSGQQGSGSEDGGAATGSRDSPGRGRGCNAKAELEATPADGLQELRREISDLESKIIGRLNNGDPSASSGHEDDTSGESAVLPVKELPVWSRSGGNHAGNGTGNTDGNGVAREMDPAGLVPIAPARAMSKKAKAGRARGQRPRTMLSRVSSSPPPLLRRRTARAEPPASSTRERDEPPLGRNAAQTGRIGPRTLVKRTKRPPKKAAPAKHVAPPGRSNGASGSYGNRSSISFTAVAAAPTRSLPIAPRMSARDGTSEHASGGDVGRGSGGGGGGRCNGLRSEGQATKPKRTGARLSVAVGKSSATAYRERPLPAREDQRKGRGRKLRRSLDKDATKVSTGRRGRDSVPPRASTTMPSPVPRRCLSLDSRGGSQSWSDRTSENEDGRVYDPPRPGSWGISSVSDVYQAN